MKNFNLDYLHTFVVVVETGSFTAAAERFNVSQPAISQQIRQLEHSLGVTLIERVGKRATPTTAGIELLGHAVRIEAVVADAVEAVSKKASSETGRVRLGTGATACIFLLPTILKDLRARFPNLEITVTTGNTSDIVKAIEVNMLDIGLVTMPASGRTFEIVPVINDEFVLIAPETMRLPARITPAVLATKPNIFFEPGGNTRRITDEWFSRSGVDVKPVMSLGSVEAIKELVAAGLGCAILPGMATSHGLALDRVTIHKLSPRLGRKLAIVMRRDKRLTAGLNYVVQALKAQAG